MNYFDAHAHIQLDQFDADRETVLSRMEESGTGAILVGVDLETSRKAVALAHARDFLWAAIGMHPNDAKDEPFDKSAFVELASHPKVVAIGECGLDFYRNEPTKEEKERQTDCFMTQLELARLMRKPLIIHCRPTAGTQNAHEDMLSILAAHPDVRAIVHFFTSTGEIAKQYLALGCYLSLPGPVTYTDMYDDSIRVATLDRILTETDSPFAAPVPYRGQRNEPVYVSEIVKKIAVLKNISAEEAAAHVVRNAQKAFAL